MADAASDVDLGRRLRWYASRRNTPARAVLGLIPLTALAVVFCLISVVGIARAMVGAARS
jgi:hypothetical protein